MIHKSELKGKYVSYKDKHGKDRIARVVRISGNTLTVQKADKVRERVYKDKIKGRQFRKRGIEPINWERKKT